MHALIIEDETYTAQMLQFALSDTGFSSYEIVTSEVEAIKAAKRQCPDLICADVTLTDGCGIKAVQYICADDAVPTIYVTGAPYRVLTSDRHANVVTKPFTLSEIHTAVRRALGEPEPVERSNLLRP